MRNLLFLFLLTAIGVFAQAPVISTSTTSLQDSQTATITCTANCTGLTWKVNGTAGGSSTIGTVSGSGSTATYTAPASIVAKNQDKGCPMFPNDSIFSTPVNTLPYLSNFHNDPYLNDAFIMGYEASLHQQNLSLEASIGAGAINNSTPTVPIQSFYGHYKDVFPDAEWPVAKREAGTVFENGNGVDHHSVFINTDDCSLHELYNDDTNAVQCSGDAAGTTNCFNASSTLKNANLYGYTWAGGTDAANNPLDPYLLKLHEVKQGVINHPLRFSITRGYNSSVGSLMWPANYGTGWCAAGVIAYNITNGGSNYSSSTTITLVGGHSVNGSPDTNEATATVTVTNGVITAVTPVSFGGDYFTNPTSVTVQLNNVGSGTGAVITPVVDYPCIPYGARLVLDPTYLAQHSGTGCSAGSKCMTGAALVVAQALATYGMADLDNTSGAIFSAYGDVDLEEDPVTYGQITSGSSGIGTLSIGNFHIVDTSPLAKNATTDHTNCSGGLPCQNGQVLPFNNAGVIPPGAAWITATNASGTSNVLSFILIPPTIGTTYTEIAVLAGDYSGSKGTSGGYQIPFWVNGITNKAVTWSLQAGAQGTITSGGVYTPPATLSTTGLQDVATATLTADPNVTTSVYIDLLPNSGNYQANTIRVNTGRTGSNFGPDGNGNYWLKEVGSEIGAASRKSDGSWNFYKGTGEGGVYPTYAYSDSDIRHRFIVPNGNYKVRILGGWGNGSPSSAMSDKNWNHMPVMILATNAGVTTIEGLHWNMMQMAAWPYAANSNSDYIFGSIVSNNVLDVAMGPDVPQPGWTTCGTTHSGSCYHQPEVSGVVVAPDASSAHWQIDVVSIPSQNGGTYIDSSQNQTVSPGKSVYLYLQDWYTGLNDATWTLLSGAGTLTPTTLQLTPNITMNVAQYTAPSTQPNDNQGVVIQAQSQSNPSVKATFTLRLKNTSAAPVNFFK